MMDNFREWLSDNLRYILLGLAVLLVVVIAFFAIRLISGGGSSKKQAETSAAPAYCHLQKNFPVRNSSKWQLLSGSGQPDAACSHIFIYVSESASEFYAVSSILLILCFLLPRTSSR